MKQISILVLIKELVSWRAILDIFLIAAGLFFLYRTLLRLGTWKIVAGILITMAVFLFASFMDLKGIEWIFSNISQVAMIALIVLFQPELRKILEQTASVKRTEPRKLDEKLSSLLRSVGLIITLVFGFIAVIFNYFKIDNILIILRSVSIINILFIVI